MARFCILFAPIRGTKAGGNPFAPDMFDYRSSNTFNYFHELNPERRALIDRLQEIVSSTEQEALEEALGDAQAVDMIRKVYSAPLMSTLDRYSPGVMLAAMNFSGLPTGAQRRLLENSIIVSGLFGLLRPDDLIPEYRLTMDVDVPGIGILAQYWKPLISPLLNEALEGRFVWDLLPSMHRQAWDDDHSYETRVEVKFFAQDGREAPKAAPFLGQLVDFIVRETVEDIESLLSWQHPAGFRFDEDRSSLDGANAMVAMVKR